MNASFNLFRLRVRIRVGVGVVVWVGSTFGSTFGSGSWGLFLEMPGNFSGPESHSKISNSTISEVFYSHILNMSRSSRRATYTSPFLDTDKLKMTLWTQKVSGSLEKQAPGLGPDPGAGLSLGPVPDLSPGRGPCPGPGLGSSPGQGPVLEMGPGPGLDPGAGLGLDPGLRPGPGL